MDSKGPGASEQFSKFSPHQELDNEFRHEQKLQTDSSEESDFFADLNDEEDWQLASKSTDHDDTYNSHGDMALDLSSVFPVGGMRRVSSCYFSICSNISSDDQNLNDNCNRGCDSPFPSVDDAATAGTTGDYLYHDILMNVFTYLDAASLAAFSETGRRPNFECFYFLELQLQRALLRGTATNQFELTAGEGSAIDNGDSDMGRCIEEDGLLFISGTGAISRVSGSK